MSGENKDLSQFLSSEFWILTTGYSILCLSRLESRSHRSKNRIQETGKRSIGHNERCQVPAGRSFRIAACFSINWAVLLDQSKIFNLQSFLLYALPVLSLSKDATSLSRLSPFDPFSSSPKQAEVRITKAHFC